MVIMPPFPVLVRPDPPIEHPDIVAAYARGFEDGAARLACEQELAKPEGHWAAMAVRERERRARAEEALRRCRAYGDGPAELVRIYFAGERSHDDGAPE